MKAKLSSIAGLKVLVWSVAALPAVASAQPTLGPLRMKLDGESTYRENYCLGPCLCAPAGQTGQLSGAFTVELIDQDPWTLYYRVYAVNMTGQLPDRTARISGTGTYEYGGDFALTHTIKLELENSTVGAHVAESDTLPPSGRFAPYIDITATGEVVICTAADYNLVSSPTCLADYNGDGFVDAIDYDRFTSDFLSAAAQSDYNGDGFSDAIDYDMFVRAFFSPC